MCGIFFILSYIKPKDDKILNIFKKFYQIKYRGPDSSIFKYIDFVLNNSMYYVTLGFHRLKIIGLDDNGNQPFYDNGVYLMCNGEIYNYKKLIDQYDLDKRITSDCHIILEIYKKYDINEVLKAINGEFAFVLMDKTKGLIYMSRDIFGIRPLFSNIDFLLQNNLLNDDLIITSEQKSNDYNSCQIDPATIYEIDFKDKLKLISKKKYFEINNYYGGLSDLSNLDNTKNNIKNILINTVEERLMSDRTIGFLLSGGLDSSLILTIALDLINNDYNKYKYLFMNGVHVFSVGLEENQNQNDIYYAKKLIEYLQNKYNKIKIIHHIIQYTMYDGYNRLNDLIYCIESYDQTTVRASLPMYLMCEYIKNNTDVKVILSGEGADELFGGYMYFHYAPNQESFHAENLKLLDNIHYFDVLRCDRCIASNGLELRVPFLDKKLIDYVLSLHYINRIPNNNEIEKKILRNSFDGFMPDEILYRQKEALSNGVGHQWTDQLKNLIYNDHNMTEDEYYLHIYKNHNYHPNNIPYKWIPNKEWVTVPNNDSSATFLSCYKK
jgi:asparagine synthase (glutamine-hydrolysing)